MRPAANLPPSSLRTQHSACQHHFRTGRVPTPGQYRRARERGAGWRAARRPGCRRRPRGAPGHEPDQGPGPRRARRTPSRPAASLRRRSGFRHRQASRAPDDPVTLADRQDAGHHQPGFATPPVGGRKPDPRPPPPQARPPQARRPAPWRRAPPPARRPGAPMESRTSRPPSGMVSAVSRPDPRCEFDDESVPADGEPGRIGARSARQTAAATTGPRGQARTSPPAPA